MSFETPITPQINKREIFINKVRSEVDRLLEEGRLTEEQVSDKLASAELIEDGFSDDPEHDARQFAGAGVFSEQEMIDLFNEKK